MNTLTEKIIKAHLVSGDLRPGQEIALRIDQTLTQDATGTMVYLQFETLGLDRVRTELSVSYIDHNTLQVDWKNMDDHRYLQTVAGRYGLWFSRAGNGICHQTHLERFAVPGKTLLGSDSHTPTGGGLGMLAIGAGGLDIAVAMAGSPFYLTMPSIIGVELTGCLQGAASAKDVILELLRRETVKGGVGKVYEYFGPGVATLSVTQRATITNMGAELGATTSIFPSDERTQEFLSDRGRGAAWQPLNADPKAVYDRIISLDLSTIEPLAAVPHSPDAVVRIADLVGLPVDQVVIGSCTNSSLDDLAAVAAIVKDQAIHPGVSAAIAPGSRATLLAANQAGIVAELIRAGFRLLESACGPCIGMGLAPKSAGVSLRTFNRNFQGRSGTADAKVYLVSPETAAAAAIAGSIRLPPVIVRPNLRSFVVSATAAAGDSGLIAPLPKEQAATVAIERGPNIKACPVAQPIADKVILPVLLKAGDNLTTDDIMPAGAQILPLRSNIPEIAKFSFSRLDPEFWQKALQATTSAVIGGSNYGQGSSREHAALAPMYLGVKAVIAKSFARIHQANLVNYGILPLVFADPADYEALAINDLLILDQIHSFLDSADETTRLPILIQRTGKPFLAVLNLDRRSRQILKAGGLAAYTKGLGS